ncbi:MAG: hypothetical protein Q9165_003130 [Trypethelium subeluteriae]
MPSGFQRTSSRDSSSPYWLHNIRGFVDAEPWNSAYRKEVISLATDRAPTVLRGVGTLELGVFQADLNMDVCEGVRRAGAIGDGEGFVDAAGEIAEDGTGDANGVVDETIDEVGDVLGVEGFVWKVCIAG